MPDVAWKDWLAGLTVDTIGGAEKMPVLDGTTNKNITTALMSAYTIDQLVAASAVTPTTGDALLMERDGAEGTFDLDALASYIVASGWAAATEVAPATNADKFLASRSGTVVELDIDTIVAYANASNGTLGAQVDGTSAATLTDADKYLVVQGTTAAKTTFTDIASRVHTQFRTHLGSLASVTELADANTFYVDQGGTAKKITATVLAAYVQAEVGAAIVSAAWDDYDTVGSAATGDILLLERTNVGKKIDVANIAAYAVATQNSASAADPVASGDDFLMFRSGTQYKVDVGVLSTYVLASAWSATSGDPVATGDKIAIGRSGSTLSVTVDQLQTFVLDGIQADVLDFSGLDAATLAGTDLFAVWNGTAPEKITLANLETQLWADFDAYVSALTAVSSPVDGDVYYVIQSGTPKKITADVLASYMDDEIWADASAADPVASGDDFLMRRSGTTYAVDVDVLASYINTSVQATVLNISGLTDATLDATDFFLVGEGSNARHATLAQLETKLWTDFTAYVNGLDAVATTVADDKFFVIQGGVAKYVTPDELATYINPGGGDVTGPEAPTPTNVPQWSGTAKGLTDGLSVFTTVRAPASAVDTAIVTEQAVAEAVADITKLDIDGATDIGAALADADLFIVDDGAGGTNRKCAASRIKTYVSATAVADFNLDGATDIGADLVDADLILVDDGANGTNRKSAISRIWTYITGKIQGLSAKTTPVDGDILLIQDSADTNALKELTIANLWDNRLLTDMMSVTDVSTATWVVDEDDMVSDLATKVPTQQSVKAYVDSQAGYDGAIATLDIDGATDIGADLVDADLLIVDDGAGGTNRKTALSRVWTYVLAKIVAITDVSTHGWVVDEDTMSSDSATKVPTQQSVKAYVDNVAGVLNNFTGTADPVAGDDTADGYSVGSLWVNTTTDQAFVCVDNSAGAAVWVSMTQAAAGWDGDLTDINFATGSDVGADLADGDQIVIADDSDSDNPKRAAMSRVKTYADKQLTASYSANQTLTAAECNGYVIYMTGAGTLTLPAIADGMSVTIITIGDVAVSIDPNAADKIWLDGPALDDGDKITNGSSAGDIAVLTYYSADGWHAATNGWTDGGA